MNELVHSINFRAKGTLGLDYYRKNTWDDWHLVPTSKPMINPGKTRYSFLDTPLFNGSVDSTENLGSTIYRDNCSGQWTFILMNDRDTIQTTSEIMGFLHGQQMYVTLYDDPSRTYYGLITIESAQSAADYASVTIAYSLNPVPTRN